MSRDLKGRLAQLRARTVLAAEQPIAGRDTVADRLARTARARRRPPAGESDEGLARRLGGAVTAAGLIEIEHRVTLPDQRALSLHQTLNGTLPGLPTMDTGDWVFVDTETTGLAGGSGTIVFLLGLARPADNALVVRQYLLTSFAGEAAMLTRALEWMGEAGLISYNGRSFDAPLLATRLRMQGIREGIADRAHLDLLHDVRRAFASVWPDCRLTTVEQRLLGIARENDLPGAEAPAAWFAHLRSADASRLGRVLDHNRQDVVTLAQLIPKLVDAYERPERLNADSEAVALGWLRRGNPSRAVTLLTRNRDCLSGRGLHALARLQRRSGQGSEACSIWRALARRGDIEAIEQLAKYHEHVCKDLAAASYWARHLPAGEARTRRLRRLTRKAAPSGLPLDETGT